MHMVSTCEFLVTVGSMSTVDCLELVPRIGDSAGKQSTAAFAARARFRAGPWRKAEENVATIFSVAL